MPAFLLKQNVFKYCQDTKQIPLYCCQAFTLFQKSFRKCREIYLTDQAIYVVSRKKLKIRIALKSIMKAYVGLLAGEFFIVSDKKNLIIDCAQGRAKFIENIKIIAQNCQIEYVNYTMLDFLFQKHKKISTKVKLTQYDDNQKKVQLKYFTGEKLNLRDLRKKWEQKSSSKDNKVQQKQKQYELTHVILTSTYWGIFSCVHKQTKKSYVAKIYSKKFIGMQQKLCNEILNQRKFSQSLSTLYTPSLVKAFYSTSNIYFIHEEWYGYLFQQFKTVKKQKFVNLFAQIVIAIGQLHQAGIVFCNLRKQDIMITLDGYVFFYNLSKSISKGEKCQLESNLKPPEYLQNQTADFGWDWWNLAQFIYEVVEKRPFYENKNDEEIEKYLKSTSDKFPPWMKLQKWQKDEHLLHLFELLIRKKPQQRLGHKNDYHEILHLKYFQDWLKEYSKSDIMKKQCPPIFKKVIRPSQKQRKSGEIEKEFIKQQDWSEMNSYLKDFQYSRDVE